MFVRAYASTRVVRITATNFSRNYEGGRGRGGGRGAAERNTTCDVGGERGTLTLQAGHVLNASCDYAVRYTIHPSTGG